VENQAALAAVIMAAGKSTRMQMRPKAALPILGKPVAQWVLEAVRVTHPEKIIVVVGHEAEAVKAAFGDGCTFVTQEPQLGTGHAVLMTKPALEGFVGDILVANADHPLLAGEDLYNLVAKHRANRAAATLLTRLRTRDSAYGRIIRDAQDRVLGIVEQRDCTPEQLALREINLGMYCFAAPRIFEILAQVGTNNAQKEYYLTDAAKLLADAGDLVQTVEAKHIGSGFGINTPEEFAQAEAYLANGVSLE
jgi:bifunctional N-acetylglucosamine-1-phosphate-uridyltransferase/glucosamine-1-phosphate-acetyltransferase GlmU-like protein